MCDPRKNSIMIDACFHENDTCEICGKGRLEPPSYFGFPERDKLQIYDNCKWGFWVYPNIEYVGPASWDENK